MESSTVKENINTEKVDYEKYVVRKALSEYWRADEKVELVTQIRRFDPITCFEFQKFIF